MVAWSAGKTMSWPVPRRPARTSGPVSSTPPGASDQSVVSHSVQVEGSPEGPTSTLEGPENCCTVESPGVRGACPVLTKKKLPFERITPEDVCKLNMNGADLSNE